LVLSVEHVEFFQTTIELEHHKDQRQDTEHHCYASQIDWNIRHAPILIVIEFYDKRL